MFNKIVKNSYNFIAEDWNETRKSLHWEEFDFFYKKFPFKNWKKILDLWCWTWRLFDFLKSKWLKSENYFWTDFSEKMIEEAKKNYPKNKYFSWDVSKKNFLENFEEKFFWKSKKEEDLKFDQIWCIAMFHHLWSKKERIQAIKNFYKILNKNWKIFLTVWNFFQPEFIEVEKNVLKNWKKNLEKNLEKKWEKKIQKNRLFKKFSKILKKSFWRNIFSLWFYSKQDCFFYWRDSDVLRYYYAFKKDEIVKLFEENWFELKFLEEWKNFSFIFEKRDMK